MIDHVLGRPSVRFRKLQVLAVVSVWSAYLLGGNRHGPPYLRTISKKLTPRLTAWQTMIISLLWLYVARNFDKLLELECPEPLANLYSPSYFRATWVTTALDAGFWTAMRIRRKWLRDILSMVFSVYYLFAAEQADEKVRKVRGMLTVDHLRVSWNKGTTPYLSFFTKMVRPRLARYPPRAIRIPRPQGSSYKEPVRAWLYFDGPLSALKDHTKMILDVPGGGFVAMDPRKNDDKLLAWAGKTGLPILSLDYKKAPEFPYPYALNECYDVYHTLVSSSGRCIGMSGEACPRIIVTGDSAGGNLACGTVLMVLQSSSTNDRWHGEEALPTPEGLILIYPGLDMNIGNWMTDDQMALIRERRMRKTNRAVLRRKSEDYNNLTPGTPHHSEDEDDVVSSLLQQQSANEDDNKTNDSQPAASSSLSTEPDPSAAHIINPNSPHTLDDQATTTASAKPTQLKTRLAMSSMISYFNDRILSPEMLRAMIILYIGPHARPDFTTDFLLSPLLAPESLLARFPKTYFLTGERDPLVDDTVIFAGRLRQAKAQVFRERQEMGLENENDEFDEKAVVDVVLIPGISHGFLQFVGVFPEAWKYIFQCARWAQQIFEQGDRDREHETFEQDVESPLLEIAGGDGLHRRHHRRTFTESSGEEDRPLEMSISSPGTTSNADGSNQSPAAPRSSTRRGGRGGRGGAKSQLPQPSSSSGAAGPPVYRKRSLVSLASEEDLLGRRMRGLAGGLTGANGGQ